MSGTRSRIRTIRTGLVLAASVGLTGILACSSGAPESSPLGSHASPPSQGATEDKEHGAMPSHIAAMCSRGQTLAILHAMNSAEIDKLQYVSGVSQNPDVRDYAKRMLDDEKQLGERFSSWIEKSGTQPVDNDIAREITGGAKRELDDLKQMYEPSGQTGFGGIGAPQALGQGAPGMQGAAQPMPQGAPSMQGGTQAPAQASEQTASPGDRAFIASEVIHDASALGFVMMAAHRGRSHGERAHEEGPHAGANATAGEEEANANVETKPGRKQEETPSPSASSAGGRAQESKGEGVHKAIEMMRDHLQQVLALQEKTVGACGTAANESNAGEQQGGSPAQGEGH
jgi:predicted outer membrane protein